MAPITEKSIAKHREQFRMGVAWRYALQRSIRSRAFGARRVRDEQFPDTAKVSDGSGAVPAPRPLLDKRTVFCHRQVMYANLFVEKNDVFFPCKREIYPDGYIVETCADRAIFRSEPIEGPTRPEKKGRGESSASDKMRAARRARARVRALAHCAPMRYFVTLTLDKEKVDRYDDKIIIRRLSQWAGNQVRRRGLSYIIIPERHKDGAIHFHGLFTDHMECVDSGTVRLPGTGRPRRPRSAKQRIDWLESGGQVIYNLPGWRYGFSTAIELYGDRSRAIGYVCKYIGKQVENGKIGGRWYYHGGTFAEPRCEYYDITARDASDIPGDWYRIEIPSAGLVLMRREYWSC